MPTSRKTPSRPPLSRARVLATAVELADRDGLDGLTMRKVGDALGVEAMSLYNHVANKGDLLDGMVDVVFAEIDLPTDAAIGWKDAMRTRCRASSGRRGSGSPARRSGSCERAGASCAAVTAARFVGGRGAECERDRGSFRAERTHPNQASA